MTVINRNRSDCRLCVPTIILKKKKSKIQSNETSLTTNEGHFFIKDKELSMIPAFSIGFFVLQKHQDLKRSSSWKETHE